MSLFYNKIQASTAHRPVRDLLCAEVLGNHQLFPELMATALSMQDTSHHKACWILELVLEKDLDMLRGYLPQFCDSLPAFTHDGAIRSVSKICLFCVQRHMRDGSFLTARQLQQVTEACFDWLISGAKVASKAYAMRALYLAGKSKAWIHPELEVILTRGFPEHSPAYKGAAKEILQKIHKA
ncbi:hypothetical protein [Flavobacterium cyanobacteriorum]|nr:hypothetical protein [Flavobacterium cyanobacteriorum]